MEFTYVLHTLDPVEPTAGLLVLPSVTYDDAKEQFDIILVPGGPSVNPLSACPEFIKRQAPGAKDHLGTKGMDLAGGFLDHLAGKELGLASRSFIELSMKAEDEDEFAAYHRLV
ncbi:hypothetical protein B0H13DRAFT_2262280 [Mycena leptocephala]|nr:hypothetical protein B0H13DRAFT_2262280 [Mycena leptocephala]